MSTSSRLAGIVKCDPRSLWCLNDIYEQFTRSGGDASKKTVKNCLGAHPDIMVIKAGNKQHDKVIGYRARPVPVEGVFILFGKLLTELGIKWVAGISIPLGSCVLWAVYCIMEWWK